MPSLVRPADGCGRVTSSREQFDTVVAVGNGLGGGAVAQAYFISAGIADRIPNAKERTIGVLKPPSVTFTAEFLKGFLNAG